MSRVIKFRALVKSGDYSEMMENVQNHIGAATGFGHLLQNTAKGVDECRVMQFTGLLDANGVEVYEGDIVEQHHFTGVRGRIHKISHQVVWSEKYDGWFCLSCSSNDENDGSVQLWVYGKTPFIVIGNIYQNKELLSCAD